MHIILIAFRKKQQQKTLYTNFIPSMIKKTVDIYDITGYYKPWVKPKTLLPCLLASACQ